jgi:hypothetical protein
VPWGNISKLPCTLLHRSGFAGWSPLGVTLAFWLCGNTGIGLGSLQLVNRLEESDLLSVIIYMQNTSGSDISFIS